MVSTSVVSLVGCVFGAEFLHDPTWQFPKIGGFPPKMDGLVHGKPYGQMDDLGGTKTPIFGSTPTSTYNSWWRDSSPRIGDAIFATIFAAEVPMGKPRVG